MKSLPFFLATLLCATPVLSAPTATEDNEGLRLSHGAGSLVFSLSWWGRDSRLYLPETSEDLMVWTPLPRVEIGRGAPISFELAIFGGRDFLRLRFSDNPDLDGDGLSNLEEVALGTSPAMADSDGDDIPDGWERAHGLNPSLASDASTFPPGGSENFRALYLAEKGMLERCAQGTLPTGVQLVVRTAAGGFCSVTSTGTIAAINAP